MRLLDRFIEWVDDLIAAIRQSYQTQYDDRPPTTPPQAPKPPVEAPLPPKDPNMYPGIDKLYEDWNTQKHAYHNVRVVCDRLGLTLEQKNILCACVWQESTFKNSAMNKNKDKTGKVLSTDFGLFQVNDYYHCGPKKTFPSVEYVLTNPEKVCEWMAGIMKKTGKLQPWVSYTSGAYKHWLSPGSPMWGLKTDD